MSDRPVRLVATDLDGTLLRADGTISDRTRAAIRDADAAGVRVVAATGRGWRSAVPLLEQVPEVTTAVCSNGALIRDIAGETTTDAFAMDIDHVDAVIDAVRHVMPGAGLAWELVTGGFGFDPAYDALRPDSAAARPELVAERPPHRGADHRDADPVLKLLVRHPVLGEAAALQVLQPVVPDGVELTSSGYGLVEVTDHGVHKAHALSVLCDRLDISAAEVVALGDNRNDVEMLRWAGRGVAMGNALPAAAAVADAVTAHHMDDGVAIVIEGVLAGLG
jgi:hydroxymethylpyrimidine pyrophosphatase-like HAD family hydrolase